MKVRKAVIPAAGYGTRFLPITKTVPKELLPIGRKPAIQYVVEEAVAAGIEEIVLVCRPTKVSVSDYFAPDPDLISFLEKKKKKEEIKELSQIESLARFTVVHQKEALGLGHAVMCARQVVGKEPFLVMLPDVLIADKTPASLQLINACQGTWGLLLERVPREKISSYGIISGEKISEKIYNVHGAVEKPSPQEAPSDLSILGRYLFPPDIFTLIEKAKEGALGEIQLTDAINSLAKQTLGRGVLCQGEIFDIGVPEGFFKAFVAEKTWNR